MKRGRKLDLVSHILANTQAKLNDEILRNENELFDLVYAQSRVSKIPVRTLLERHTKRILQYIRLKEGIRTGKTKVKKNGSK